MAALATRIAAMRSAFGSGGAVNPLNMRSSAGSLVEGWGVDVREGATPDWEVVDMRAVGSAGADIDVGEGDDGPITIGRGGGGLDGCSCGCGCDC